MCGMALEKDRENLFFIDVQARGAYPSYSARVFREKGVTIEKQPADDEILKKHRRFCLVQLLRLSLRVGRHERQQHQCGKHC
ncbi:6-phospho-beta-glucosidase ascB [Raoultella ornithinolytica]|nr:6-phospho-beta-glucosidase ascB [Raoultella ornithinolytica]